MATGVATKYFLLFVLVTGLLVAFGCADRGGGGGGDGPEIQLATLINNARSNPMNYDAAIAAVEQAHAEWLSQQPPAPFTYPYYEEGEGGKYFADRLNDASITFSECKEYGFDDESLSNANLVWEQLQSTDILDTKWDTFGIGFKAPPGRESGRRYWVIGVINK